MKRREVIQTVGLAAAASMLPIGTRALAAEQELSERTHTLLKESFILDMTGANSPIHPVTMQPVNYENWVNKYKKAKVTWLSMTAGSDFGKSLGPAMKALAASRRHILTRPDEYVFVRSMDDVRRAKAEGKLGVNFNLQGTNPLEGDINLVEPLYQMGVGHMLLTYNDMNLAGGGSHDPDETGLTYYGRELVKEMNRVGMVVDCTHMAYRSTLDIMEASSEPVIFSHSSARALRDHERNIRDEQIKALGENGGVIGVNGVGLFLSLNMYDTSASHLFRHIDHIAELIGDEHVGLGLDHVPGMDDPLPVENVVPQYTQRYGEGQYPPMNRLAIAGPSVIAPLTEEMVRHGYSDQQIKGILGGNFMRLFDRVWKT